MKSIKTFLCIIMMCLCVGCSTPSSNSSSSTKTSQESGIPRNYVATVVVSINPKVKLYLDVDSKVIFVEALNKDAESIVNQKDCKGITVDEVVTTIIEQSIDKGFISKEKGNEVKITVDEVKNEKFEIQPLVTKCENVATTTLKEAKIDNKVETSMSDEVTQIKESQVTTCTTCNGSGYVCPTCSGTSCEDCRCCNATGYEDCKTCPASGKYNCHGCHGSGQDHGETCKYCNGSGKMTCEVCGGKHYKYKLCSRCAGFKLACPKCETAVKVCPTCNGEKAI